jgi:hypothetical protein
MLRLRTSRPTVAVLVAAALILTAGGAAVASNMGFKMNKPLVKIATGQTGNNWTSIPYHNPYGTINGFCTQVGLISSGITRSQITTKNYVTDTEGFKTYNCGQTAPVPPALVPGKMFQIRQPVAGVDSIIIVGSHNSAQPITFTENLDSWFSVPYHTTWVNTNDFCTQATLTSTGVTRATVTRLNPGPPAAFQTTTCGSTTTFFNLVLGEGLQVREANSIAGTRVVTFTPAHY